MQDQNGELSNGLRGKSLDNSDNSLLSKVLFGWFDHFVRRCDFIREEQVPPLKDRFRAYSLMEKWNLSVKELGLSSYFRSRSKSSFTDSWMANGTLKLILLTCKANIVSSAILDTFRVLFALLIPYSLKLIISHVDKQEIVVLAELEDRNMTTTTSEIHSTYTLPFLGLFYVLVLVLVNFVGSLVETHAYFQLNIAGLKAKSTLTAAIFSKALAMRQPKDSDVVNLVSVDLAILQKAFRFLNLPWSCPLQLTLSTVYLFYILGLSIVPGLLGLFTILFVSVMLSWRMQECQQEQLDRKDQRMIKIVEVLNHMKVIKSNVWEHTFEKAVEEVRHLEIKSLKSFLFIQAVQSFLWNCAIFLVAFLAFSAYSLLHIDHLTAEITFVSLAIFNNMRTAFRMIPSCISSWSQSWVSIKRINEFLRSEEVQVKAAKRSNHQGKNESAVVMQNCQFSRSQENSSFSSELCLENVSCAVRSGQLVGVIGPMGSGKTSFIEAIAGEHYMSKGQMDVTGKVTFVTNTPWLKSGTIRDNILFGSVMNLETYEKVISACGLKDDFKRLVKGDQTWIHGCGENLSGGQRQRISLARAIFNGGNIFLMDDPLSAVDPRLRQAIFNDVIGSRGILSNHTRIVVMNEMSFVSQMDMLLMLKDRSVVDFGTLSDLKSRHDLDMEVWHHETLEELDKLIQQGSTIRKRPVMCRQDTLTTRDILQSMKSMGFDDVDEIIHDSVTPENYLYYLDHMGKMALSFPLLGYVASQAFDVVSRIWLADWTARSKVKEARFEFDIPDEKNFITVYGFLGLFQALTYLFAVLKSNDCTLLASINIHKEIFHKVIYSTIEFLWSNQVGAVANRFSKDMNELDLNLPNTLKNFAFQIMRILGTLFLVVFTFPINFFAMIPFIIAVSIIFRYYIIISRLFRRLSSSTMASLNSFLTESVNGVQTIRSFGVQSYSTDQCIREIDDHQKHNLMEIISDGWLFVRLQIFMSIFLGSLGAIIVWYHDSISSHMAGLCLTSATMIMSDIFLFTRHAAALEKSMVSVERLHQYMTIKQEPISPLLTFPIPSLKLSRNKGEISFNQITGRYPVRGDICLKNVSFTVRAGEKVGVVGRTGAGKSSIALALFRFLDTMDGTISIDGSDIARMDLVKHRSRLTLIPQDPALFNGSIRYNLDPSSKLSDYHIWECLRSVNLATFISQFPGGLDFIIDSDGTALSEGQRQIICCIRGLLKESKIVILDEATSLLPNSMETQVLQSVTERFKSSTIIMITHRVHRVLGMDRVLVMDGGRVREFDTPMKLVSNRGSLFHSMLKEARGKRRFSTGQ